MFTYSSIRLVASQPGRASSLQLYIYRISSRWAHVHPVNTRTCLTSSLHAVWAGIPDRITYINYSPNNEHLYVILLHQGYGPRFLESKLAVNSCSRKHMSSTKQVRTTEAAVNAAEYFSTEGCPVQGARRGGVK